MATKKEKSSRALLSDYQVVFSSPQGQKVLWDLMKSSRMLDTTLDHDPMKMAFNEGCRNIVLHILRKLKTDVKALEALIEKGHDYDRELWE